MPSSPARPPRPPPKPEKPSAPRRTQSYTPRNTPAPPPAVRRHTTYTPRPSPSPRRSPAPAKASSPRRRTTTTPVRGGQHVLIPVPVRAKDSESPVYVRAPPGQRVDFVFSAPKKRGIIGRLLDSVEWGGPEENKPFRYHKPDSKHSGRPFYKKLMS